ncbi:hypothetical protein NX801_25480 [Streptomyces sp. LP05-1]|uniref:Uncharacterized protein n=1 Tax=Streptomyces pyxinae TaxID=2970734 RepID=A0ABT2CND9_9ACTN|nr:hypothetical protein [Streptomyces sp. LP05-1]MCS0638939.1 hypothetical protein [Streptomyces sp. LP05-1]
MSQGLSGVERAHVGEEWWFALPVPVNTSSKDIRVTGVRVVEVPDGLQVAGYGAFKLKDTQGLYLLSREGEEETPKFDRLKDYFNQPVTVRAKNSSDIYYLVRLKVKGRVTGNVKGCRFEYEQGSRRYTQTLRCEAEIRLARRK